MSRPALVSTKPPIQWVADFFPGGKVFRAWSWWLRLRMSGTIPLPPSLHIPWWQGQGQFYFYIMFTLWHTQSTPFYGAISPIVPQIFTYKAEIWTLLSSSPSSGNWDWRWNQHTHSLQTEFNPVTADYRSSVRCFFTHSWYLCKKLIFEVLEKVSELFFFDTFHLLFKYVRVWSLNFLWSPRPTEVGHRQLAPPILLPNFFPQSADTFSCRVHSCHVVFVRVCGSRSEMSTQLYLFHTRFRSSSVLEENRYSYSICTNTAPWSNFRTTSFSLIYSICLSCCGLQCLLRIAPHL